MFGRKKKALEGEAAGPAEPPQRFARSPSDALKPAAAAPPPPPPRRGRRRGGLLSALSSFLTLIIAVALAGVVGMMMLEREVTSPGPLQADKVVAIPRNSGTGEIAELLRREGVISQPFLFQVYALMNRKRGQLKAGEFLFKAGTSIDAAIDTLAEGKAILHSVTIPEGWTSEQVVARLNESEALTGEVTEIPREGTLLPDTYKFERGASRQQILNAMQTAQKNAVTQIWARRAPDLPIKTPQELVILASIVEKETGRADERTRVAGVFINRLQKRMRLQSDPTIVYGLVGGKGTLGRGILRSEIEKPTPYNTYAVEGLPPGPIANPGRAALEAVANPSRTKDLYFVADGTGGHVFAETLDQHNRNVARWRQIERSRAPGEGGVVDRVEPPVPENRTDAAPVVPTILAARFTRAPMPPLGVPQTFVRPEPPKPARIRSADASEGTALDPLLNRSFDLTTPKTVPTLTQ
jgi:UPF0755 protein